MGTLLNDTKPLIEALTDLHRQAEAMGIFLDHRDLAECDACQLYEDETHFGALIVYRHPDHQQDTGLRFKEVGENAVVCPGCGRHFCPYDAEMAAWLHASD